MMKFNNSIRSHFFLLKQIDVLRTLNDKSISFEKIEKLLLRVMTKQEYDDTFNIKCLNINRQIIQSTLRQRSHASIVLIIHKELTHLSMITPVLSIAIHESAKILGIKELIGVIFSYLDSKTFHNCISVCQQWLYHGYDPASNKHCQLSTSPFHLPFKLCYNLVEEDIIYSKDENGDVDDSEYTYKFQSESLQLIAKYNLNILQRHCENVLIQQDDILNWLKKPRTGASFESWHRMNLLMNMTNTWKFDKVKHVTIVQTTDHFMTRYNRNHDDYDKLWKQWISKWIQNHSNNIRDIHIHVQNGYSWHKYQWFQQTDSCYFPNCLKVINHHKKIFERVKKKEITLLDEWINIYKNNCKNSDNVKISFKIPNFLSHISILTDRCDVWTNASLDLTKSQKLLTLLYKLYDWYKLENVNARIDFNVTHDNFCLHCVENLQDEKWIQLIIKGIKNVFKINDTNWYPFDDCIWDAENDHDDDDQSSQQTISLNDRIYVKLFNPLKSDTCNKNQVIVQSKLCIILIDNCRIIPSSDIVKKISEMKELTLVSECVNDN